MKKIIVEYESEILGSGVFWRGNETEIDDIRNIVAKILAKKVVVDGVPRSSGMWKVYIGESDES